MYCTAIRSEDEVTALSMEDAVLQHEDATCSMLIPTGDDYYLFFLDLTDGK